MSIPVFDTNLLDNSARLTAAELLQRGLEAHRQLAFEQARETLQAATERARFEQNWQVQTDALIALARTLREVSEPQLALDSLGQALGMAEGNADLSRQADVLNQRAGVNHHLGEYALALRDLQKALTIIEEFADQRRSTNILINMGILSTKLADYPKALSLLTEAHKRARDFNDSVVEGQCFINLGLLYEEMGDDYKALEVYKQALPNVTGSGLEAIITVNLGFVYKRLQQFDIARQSFQKALTLSDQYARVEIASLDGLGQIESQQGRVHQALELHHRALSRARETSDLESEIDALINLGRNYLLDKNPAQAKTMLDTALDIAQGVRQKSLLEIYPLLSETYERFGDVSQALRYYKMFHQVDKQLFNEDNQKKTRQLTVQFDLERTQYQAEVYRIHTEIEREAKERAEAMVEQRTKELKESHQTIERQHQELQDKFIELGNLLKQNEILRQRLMLAARRNTTLNEEFLRRLSAELHDGPAQDLGYAVIKLGSGQIDAMVDHLPQEKQAVYLKELETVQSSISRALKEMRAIAAGMCLPELNHLSLTEAAMRAINSHQRRTQTEVEFDFDGQFGDVALPVKITVYRLVQESLMNGFKHGASGQQTVHMYIENTHLHLEISDQGPGFELNDTLEYSGRLGLLGMRERVESLGGKFWIDTAPNKGTRVHAVLPLIV